MDMSNYNDPHWEPTDEERIKIREEFELQKAFDYYREDFNNWTLPWYDNEVDPGFECPACFGSGLDRHEEVDCLNCWGEGRIYGTV